MLGRERAVSTLAPDYAELIGGYNGAISVPVRTLDDIIDEFGEPAFVKIDVEGYDQEVLRGLSRAVPSLSFEYHGVLPERTDGCVRELNRVGDYLFNGVIGESTEWLVSEFGAPNRVVEAIGELATNDRKLYGDIHAIHILNRSAARTFVTRLVASWLVACASMPQPSPRGQAR